MKLLAWRFRTQIFAKNELSN